MVWFLILSTRDQFIREADVMIEGSQNPSQNSDGKVEWADPRISGAQVQQH
jgi:hypothetical protein